ncbi:MAG TPA: glycosyltransferase family 39 protein [Candidatus Xenobia bacterium]
MPELSRRDARWALAAVLALATFLDFYRLDAPSFSPYYGAAVRSMLSNWHNFVFAAFDPGGFLTTDKPPGALWVQAISAYLFGYSRFALCLPQAVAGVLSTALVYTLVARAFDRTTGVLAALFYGVVPITVAVNRYNLPDGLLVFVSLLAAAALLQACRSGRILWLLASGALVGVGFNIKLVAAWLILPALLGTWGLTGPRGRKLSGALAFLLAMSVVSLGWMSYVDTLPADQRPHVESSEDDTMLDTALFWDGLNRLPPGLVTALHLPAHPRPSPTRAFRPRRRQFEPGDSGSPGVTRLFDVSLAGQIAWFAVLAAAGMLLGRPRRDDPPERVAAWWLWTLWLLSIALVYSSTRSLHRHYLNMLSPAEAALAAWGVMAVWRHGGWLRPVVLVGSGLTGAAIMSCFPAMTPWTVGLLALTAVGLWSRPLALAALVVGPACWTGFALAIQPGQQFPFAGPELLAARLQAHPDNSRLEHYLEAHQARTRFMVAVSNASDASSLIISSGRPVLTMAGFTGRTPALTGVDLEAMVAHDEVHYFLIGGARRGGPDELSRWVRDHGQEVPDQAWQDAAGEGRRRPHLYFVR